MDMQLSSVDRLVTRIRRAQLDGLAIVLLEGFRPLAPLLSQVAYLVQPLIRGRGDPLLEIGRLMERPADIDDLIDRLSREEEGTTWTS